MRKQISAWSHDPDNWPLGDAILWLWRRRQGTVIVAAIIIATQMAVPWLYLLVIAGVIIGLGVIAVMVALGLVLMGFATERYMDLADARRVQDLVEQPASRTRIAGEVLCSAGLCCRCC